MSHQTFTHGHRQEDQIPHNSHVFEALVTFPDFPSQNVCEELRRSNTQQYSLNNSTNLEHLQYRYISDVDMHSRCAPNSGYQFGMPAQYFPTNSTLMGNDCYDGLPWYDEIQTSPELSNTAVSPFYDPRGPLLPLTQYSASPNAGDSHQANDFDSPPKEDSTSFGSLDIVNGIHYHDLTPMDDIDIKMETGSEDPYSNHSEDGDGEYSEHSGNMNDRITEEPYAKLIFRALMAAPEHSMALKEIYDWFEVNTDKVKPGVNGWRNSIRHNLSMNAAFDKLYPRPVGDARKKNSIWVLNREAVHNGGVAPTTRYRKDSKKSLKAQIPTRVKKSAGSCKASTTTSKVKQEGVNYGSSFCASGNFQQSFEDSRHSSALPDSRHLSPSTPTGSDFPPVYFHRPSLLLDMHGQPQHGFGDVNSLYIDSTPVFRGDGRNVQHWPGGYDY